MAKIIAELKTKEDFIQEHSSLNINITLSDLSKRGGFVKGIVDYGYVENFGTVRIPFQYAYNEDGDFEDWTYEDGTNIPYEVYIWETIKMLDEEKLLNK